MCKVLEERFNSQLGVIGASRAIIDMQFGKGFTKGIELGRTMSVDTLRRLSNTLGCSPEWLTGEDIKGGNTADLPAQIQVSSERLKNRRTYIGYSQVALAQLVGKKYGTEISKYERTGCAISKDTLMAICHYLRCSIEYLQGKTPIQGDYPQTIPDSVAKKQKDTMVTIQSGLIARHISEGKMSPAEFAKQVGIPRSYVSKIRNGSRNIVPLYTFERMCKILKLSPKDLVIPVSGLSEQILKNSKTDEDKDLDKIKEEVYEDQNVQLQHQAILPVKEDLCEVVQVEDKNDVRISLARLGQVTQFAEKHPDLLALFDQVAELKPEQIEHIKVTLDLLIKGCIVS